MSLSEEAEIRSFGSVKYILYRMDSGHFFRIIRVAKMCAPSEMCLSTSVKALFYFHCGIWYFKAERRVPNRDLIENEARISSLP